jgi:hypothetical protein
MDYSAKYRVSLSTLRRRIKSGEIESKLLDGKYVLKDGPLIWNLTPEAVAPPPKVSYQAQVTEEPSMSSTQILLNEIKRAYSLILQEKEEQILQLKEEVADLKTLVRVLEEDNARVKSLQPKLDFDLGLEV